MSTIDVTAIEKSFGRTRALNGVTFQATGGVTGLLGPNGAGKTTLLRVLATVLSPDAGTVRLLGRDTSDTQARTEVRRRLGYLPQDPGYHRSFTAFEFVDYVAILKELTNRRDRHDEVRRVLDLVGLAEVSGRRIRSLSGGMRRRVGVAQAMLGDPDLVVLDEPMVALDPEQRLRFRDLISRLGERRTVVLSTHQTEDVAALCGRVVVIDGGRSLFDGTPAEMAGLAQGRVWLAGQRTPGARLAWRTGSGDYRNIGDTAPTGVALTVPTIEDAYLLLVGEGALGTAV